MKTVEILHMVTYAHSDLVGYDLNIEGKRKFFTVEELKIALQQRAFQCQDVFLSPQKQLRHSPYLPQRNMEEEEFYRHPSLSHRENLDMLQGISWKRQYTYTKKEDGTYLATFFQGQGITAVYARPSLEGQPVTSIHWIFQGNIPTDLEEIIPFLPPSPLESVVLGQEEEFLPYLLWICGEKEEISEKAWAKQRELTQVILEKPLKVIGNTSFSTCPKLETVHFPDSLEEIQEHAFSYTAIKEISFPPTLQILGSSAFSHCQDLEEISLPEGITVVEESCFAQNSELKSVSFPSSLQKIEKNAFHACGLEELVLPEGLEEIGEGAFSHCASLSLVHFPSSLKRIGKNAFAHSGIQEISLGESVVFLGAGVFQNCLKLKKVSLCENTKSVGDYSFAGCVNLKKLTFTPSFSGEKNQLFLGAWSFHQTGLEEVLFPENLVEIEENAFYDCKYLWNVRFSQELQRVGEYAFAQTALLEVQLPPSLAVLGEDVFEGCPLRISYNK